MVIYLISHPDMLPISWRCFICWGGILFPWRIITTIIFTSRTSLVFCTNDARSLNQCTSGSCYSNISSSRLYSYPFQVVHTTSSCAPAVYNSSRDLVRDWIVRNKASQYYCPIQICWLLPSCFTFLALPPELDPIIAHHHICIWFTAPPPMGRTLIQ